MMASSENSTIAASWAASSPSPALADVPNERGRETTLVGLDRRQGNVDRKLALVLATTDGLLVDEDDRSAFVTTTPGADSSSAEPLAAACVRCRPSRSRSRKRRPGTRRFRDVVGLERGTRPDNPRVRTEKRSGRRRSIGSPSNSSRVYPKSRSASALTSCTAPSSPTITTASGAKATSRGSAPRSSEDTFRKLALGHVADELLDHARDGLDGEARLAVGGAADCLENLRRRGAFDHVAHRTGRQHLDHGCLIVVGREGESPRRRRAILGCANDLGSTAGHAHVDEGDVRLRGRGELDRLGRAPSRADDLHPLLSGDEVAQSEAERLFVLRYQDSQYRSFSVVHRRGGPSRRLSGLASVVFVAERRASAGNPTTPIGAERLQTSIPITAYRYG